MFIRMCVSKTAHVIESLVPLHYGLRFGLMFRFGCSFGFLGPGSAGDVRFALSPTDGQVEHASGERSAAMSGSVYHCVVYILSPAVF